MRWHLTLPAEYWLSSLLAELRPAGDQSVFFKALDVLVSNPFTGGNNEFFEESDMSIVQFNPWRELDRLSASPATSNGWTPAVDVWETPEAFRIDVEIPAVLTEDVDVSVEEGVLRIHGVRKQSERGEDDANHRLERRYGSFSRSFKLPENADEENISARVENGLLALSINKKSVLEPRRIEVIAA